MGMAFSILLIAAGAIMRFAVSVQTKGFNVHTAGVVLLLVGILGAVLSAIFWASWGGFGGAGRTTAGGAVTGRSTTVTEEREVR